MQLAELVNKSCLEQLTDPKSYAWYIEKFKNLTPDFSPDQFYISFGLVRRKIPNRPLCLHNEQLKIIQQAYPAFNSNLWNLQEWSRLSFILNLPLAQQPDILNTLFETADKSELITLYRLLPFLQNPRQYIHRATDGIRTNMTDVFDAIAVNNPFPAIHFSENAWNQLVLKSIFMQRPLYKIYGLNQRRNKTLAVMALDFAHERWAAGRTVTPELWRLLSGYLDDCNFEDIHKIITHGDGLSQQAGLLVISESNYQSAKNWLLTNQLSSATMSWNDIGIAFNQAE